MIGLMVIKYFIKLIFYKSIFIYPYLSEGAPAQGEAKGLIFI